MQIQKIAIIVAAVAVAAAMALVIDRPASNSESVSNKTGHLEARDPSEAFVGIGVAIKLPPATGGKHIFRDACEISFLQPDQPAALSGELAVGDLIVAVAQGADPPINCQGREFREVVNLLEGPEGSEVRLTIIPTGSRAAQKKVVAFIRESLRGADLIGKTAPDVLVTRLAGSGTVNLRNFLGKIVVLEIWTSSCAPCIMAVRAMQTYPQQYPAWGERVALLALSVDEKQETANDRLGQEDWKITDNVWGDAQVKRAFDAVVLPLVVVIDAEGTIVAAGNPQNVNVSKIVDGLLGP
ncbi:MAG TPA: redoxin domain-containing protein [Planctomycetaceae bacterium]|jgi:thiol-disulfide isomerase/thioredoxin